MLPSYMIKDVPVYWLFAFLFTNWLKQNIGATHFRKNVSKECLPSKSL